MTDIQEPPAGTVQLPEGSELVERGRHAIFAKPDGDWAVLRAAGICERCQTCGCGEQQDPLPIPKLLVPYITGEAQMNMKDMFSMVKGMFGNGK